MNEIQKLDYPLSRAFFIDMDNPFADTEFATFSSKLRENVKRGNDLSVTRDRKRINASETEICVGSLAHELLDLLNLIGPMPRQDLFDLYCGIKGFERSKIKVYSTILTEDMRRPVDIKIDDVLDLLIACGLVSVTQRAFLGMDTVSSLVKLDVFFMFKGRTVNSVAELNKLRAMVHLRKRSFAKGYDKNDYLHFNGK